MKLCIVGAGAMGGLIGGLIAISEAGTEVSFVARGPHLDAMVRDGLRLEIGSRAHTVFSRFTSNPEELGTQDYVFLTLKAHQVAAAVDSLVPLLGPETVIVTAMNGLPYWYFYRHGGPFRGTHLKSVDPEGRQWQVLGPERAIGCVPYPAADLVAPGIVRHAHGMKFPIGEPSGVVSDRLLVLQRIMTDAGFDVPIRSDIRDEIWLKLWGNLCLNPIGVLTHAPVRIIATDPLTRQLARHMMMEAREVAERLGVHFRVTIERRLDGAGAVGDHKMSTLQDIECGKPTEIDALLGVISELGSLVGSPTPLADALLALVKQKERMRLERHSVTGP